MTAAQLEAEFDVYFAEIERCLATKCYWALLHLLVAIPDICSSLQAPSAKAGPRYVGWCKEHMPIDPLLSPDGRYAMRNMVLHAGTTDASSPAVWTKPTFKFLSFVDPAHFSSEVHHTLSKGGDVLNIHMVRLADDTRAAMRAWFKALESDTKRQTAVLANLPKLVRVNRKVEIVQRVEPGAGLVAWVQVGASTSSTGRSGSS